MEWSWITFSIPGDILSLGRNAHSYGELPSNFGNRQFNTRSVTRPQFVNVSSMWMSGICGFGYPLLKVEIAKTRKPLRPLITGKRYFLKLMILHVIATERHPIIYWIMKRSGSWKSSFVVSDESKITNFESDSQRKYTQVNEWCSDF